MRFVAFDTAAVAALSLLQVHGIIRRSSSFNTGRIAHLFSNPVTHEQKQMVLHYGDLTDSSCLVKIISEVRWVLPPPSPRRFCLAPHCQCRSIADSPDRSVQPRRHEPRQGVGPHGRRSPGWQGQGLLASEQKPPSHPIHMTRR